ncbi:MAG TPA: hypothetical protein VEL82_06955 [Thermoplasmata archaeon]|nr:hypothetical protein [Thermoplasmata archaeon]
MHDSVATFYGGYDQLGLGRLPRLRVPRVALAVGVAVVVLVVLIAADVGAIDGRTASVEVSSVSWYADTELLTTEPGFSTHGSSAVALSLSCDLICYRFDGVSVSAPFSLVSSSITEQPIQYVNVTVRAPASAFSGPLAITLSVG